MPGAPFNWPRSPAPPSSSHPQPSTNPSRHRSTCSAAPSSLRRRGHATPPHPGPPQPRRSSAVPPGGPPSPLAPNPPMPRPEFRPETVACKSPARSIPRRRRTTGRPDSCTPPETPPGLPRLLSRPGDALPRPVREHTAALTAGRRRRAPGTPSLLDSGQGEPHLNLLFLLHPMSWPVGHSRGWAPNTGGFPFPMAAAAVASAAPNTPVPRTWLRWFTRATSSLPGPNLVQN